MLLRYAFRIQEFSLFYTKSVTMNIISSLSNSLRSLALHDACAKSMLAVTQFKIHHQAFHIQQPMFKSVEEKLGLPIKPKRPLTPYFRFLNDLRPSIIEKNPGLKSTQINSIISNIWKDVDATKKDSFLKRYRVELSDYYSNEYAKYKANLSEDDIRKIKEMKLQIKKRRILSSKRKQNKILGKPKKPMNSFLRYVKAKAETERRPNEIYKDCVKRLTLTWKELSDTEKEKYNSPKEFEEYEKALAKWEENMRESGHTDVIRVKNQSNKRSPSN